MSMRGISDLDNLLRDFMDQLYEATRDGWYRTRPEHYREILAALDSALRERDERRGAQAGSASRPCLSEPRSSEGLMSFVFGRPGKPILSPIMVPRRTK
jgi:hypothetical protein